jgi:RNA polymerase sigma factor (sigma-70 family)
MIYHDVRGLCTREDEQKLGRLIQAGDLSARNELVERNTPLVRMLARHVPRAHREDAFQAGIMGMMKAADKFDPDANIKFSTYAVRWIKQAMFREVWHTTVVWVPVWHAYPTQAQQDRPRTVAMLAAGLKAKSCDHAMVDCDDRKSNPGDACECEELRDAVCIALDSLEPSVRKIIAARIATDGPPVPLRALGREHGVTGECIRQIEQRGLAKLRKLLEAWK